MLLTLLIQQDVLEMCGVEVGSLLEPFLVTNECIHIGE